MNIAHVGKAFDLLSGGAICIAAVLVCLDVAARAVFGTSIDGAAEAGALLVGVILFIQLPASVLGRKLTSTELIQASGAPGVIRRILQWIGAVATALVFGAIAVAVWPGLLAAFGSGEYLGVQGIFELPAWPFRATIVLGAAFCCIFALVAPFLPEAEEQPGSEDE